MELPLVLYWHGHPEEGETVHLHEEPDANTSKHMLCAIHDSMTSQRLLVDFNEKVAK